MSGGADVGGRAEAALDRARGKAGRLAASAREDAALRGGFGWLTDFATEAVAGGGDNERACRASSAFSAMARRAKNGSSALTTSCRIRSGGALRALPYPGPCAAGDPRSAGGVTATVTSARLVTEACVPKTFFFCFGLPRTT